MGDRDRKMEEGREIVCEGVRESEDLSLDAEGNQAKVLGLSKFVENGEFG